MAGVEVGAAATFKPGSSKNTYIYVFLGLPTRCACMHSLVAERTILGTTKSWARSPKNDCTRNYDTVRVLVLHVVVLVGIDQHVFFSSKVECLLHCLISQVLLV